MNNIPSPRVFLATAFLPKQVDDRIVPALNEIGVTVVRVVPIDFKGPLDGVDAVLFMFQYCSHGAHDKFKARCKTAGVKFVLLEQQTANWTFVLTRAGLKLPGHPVEARPMPVPLPPVVHAKQEVHEVEEPEDSGPPSPPEPFHVALRRERSLAKLTQSDLGKLIGVSQSAICSWEDGGAVPEVCYEALIGLIPALAKAAKPAFATRLQRLGKTKANGQLPEAKPATNGHTNVAAVVTLPPVVEVRPAPAPVPIVKANGHPPPLTGLLRAARALGVTGPLTVVVNDETTQVRAGEETWSGASPDAAVETARAALDARLGEWLRRIEDARSALAGGAS